MPSLLSPPRKEITKETVIKFNLIKYLYLIKSLFEMSHSNYFNHSIIVGSNQPRPFNSSDAFIEDPISVDNLAILQLRNSSSNTALSLSDFNSMDAFIKRPLSAADIERLTTRPITVYSTSHLGGASNKKDKEIVFEAAAIANSITKRTGYCGRLSLGDISDKLDESKLEFDISGVRPSTAKSRERFRKSYGSCNKGNDKVNIETLTKYLKCCSVMALASVQEVDSNNPKLVGQQSMTYSNFRENYIKPILSLYFSQHKDAEHDTFPYPLRNLINTCKRGVAAHLPIVHAKTIICRSLCQLLILCCPLGSYYMLGFCFLLTLLVMCGRRFGPISRMRLTDIEEIVILKDSKGIEPKLLHLSVVFKLSRDKNR